MFNQKQLALLACINDEYSVEGKNRIESIQKTELVTISEALNELIEIYENYSIVHTENLLTNQISRLVQNDREYSKYLDLIKKYINNGIRIISYWDPDYPDRLRKISSPPLLIYVRGDVTLDNRSVAIVGTRHPSLSGTRLAYEYARYFAENGFAIVSGLALGIDTSAHRGALSVDGKTIAVLGNQVSSIYPKENYDLANEILKKGAIVSEMTDFAYMHRGRFIERNRIISGLSHAVIAVEASKNGGTIHQAKFAIDQKRPLYAIRQMDFSNPDNRKGFEILVGLGAISISNPSEVIFGPKTKQQKLI